MSYRSVFHDDIVGRIATGDYSFSAKSAVRQLMPNIKPTPAQKNRLIERQLCHDYNNEISKFKDNNGNRLFYAVEKSPGVWVQIYVYKASPVELQEIIDRHGDVKLTMTREIVHLSTMKAAIEAEAAEGHISDLNYDAVLVFRANVA